MLADADQRFDVFLLTDFHGYGRPWLNLRDALMRLSPGRCSLPERKGLCFLHNISKG